MQMTTTSDDVGVEFGCEGLYFIFKHGPKVRKAVNESKNFII